MVGHLSLLVVVEVSSADSVEKRGGSEKDRCRSSLFCGLLLIPDQKTNANFSPLLLHACGAAWRSLEAHRSRSLMSVSTLDNSHCISCDPSANL